MRIKFSQKWAKSERGARIRKILWMTVKAARATRKCKTLLVKVFFYTNENYKKCYSGNYRNKGAMVSTLRNGIYVLKSLML